MLMTFVGHVLVHIKLVVVDFWFFVGDFGCYVVGDSSRKETVEVGEGHFP